MTEAIKIGAKWEDLIETLNETNVLEAKIVERNIKKRKNRGEDLKGNTLFIKKKDTSYKTVYRKNIKAEKDAFLQQVVNPNVIDYINTNLV
ncbi:MAG: hypothetical protein ACOCV8_04040 [Spirochaetota bacterium]